MFCALEEGLHDTERCPHATLGQHECPIEKSGTEQSTRAVTMGKGINTQKNDKYSTEIRHVLKVDVIDVGTGDV